MLFNLVSITERYFSGAINILSAAATNVTCISSSAKGTHPKKKEIPSEKKRTFLKNTHT